MDYGYGNGGGAMWVFGGLMMLGVVVLIGVLIWAVVGRNNHPHSTPVHTAADAGSPARIRHILDERYARGEVNSEEYTERLRTLGL